jgi:hypothetical protein
MHIRGRVAKKGSEQKDFDRIKHRKPDETVQVRGRRFSAWDCEEASDWIWELEATLHFRRIPQNTSIRPCFPAQRNNSKQLHYRELPRASHRAKLLVIRFFNVLEINWDLVKTLILKSRSRLSSRQQKTTAKNINCTSFYLYSRNLS